VALGPIFKTALFTVLVPGTVTTLLPYVLLSRNTALPSHPLADIRWLGFVPLSLGAAIYLACAWRFATEGKGTPAPVSPTRFLVRRRLYQKVRNPMYVGVLLILFGEALVFESAVLTLYACAVMLGFHLFVVLYEEPHLRGRFGESYEEYKRRVPRWTPKF
jgi:protein-S-isoprenylcysteine O-methyltransferase Ste14